MLPKESAKKEEKKIPFPAPIGQESQDAKREGGATLGPELSWGREEEVLRELGCLPHCNGNRRGEKPDAAAGEIGGKGKYV